MQTDRKQHQHGISRHPCRDIRVQMDGIIIYSSVLWKQFDIPQFQIHIVTKKFSDTARGPLPNIWQAISPLQFQGMWSNQRFYWALSVVEQHLKEKHRNGIANHLLPAGQLWHYKLSSSHVIGASEACLNQMVCCLPRNLQSLRGLPGTSRSATSLNSTGCHAGHCSCRQTTGTLWGLYGVFAHGKGYCGEQGETKRD